MRFLFTASEMKQFSCFNFNTLEYCVVFSTVQGGGKILRNPSLERGDWHTHHFCAWQTNGQIPWGKLRSFFNNGCCFRLETFVGARMTKDALSRHSCPKNVSLCWTVWVEIVFWLQVFCFSWLFYGFMFNILYLYFDKFF